MGGEGRPYLVWLFGAVSNKLLWNTQKSTNGMQRKGTTEHILRQSNINISHDSLINGQNE